MLWQWSIHLPGLSVSNTVSTVASGGTSTVSLRASGWPLLTTWNVCPCKCMG